MHEEFEELDEGQIDRIRQWLRETPDSCCEDDPPEDFKKAMPAFESLSFLSRASTERSCSRKKLKVVNGKSSPKGCLAGISKILKT